ncbi:MAG: ATP-binding protein, partial [Endomicrobium sp.]|nr:ATP-binding protein [Endomicrobium sp.]
MLEKIQKLISKGEGLSLEFKECKGGISHTIYETVCAFLNTKGGEILLGISDSGKIIGIEKDKIADIKQDFVNTVNNPIKLSPSFCLSIEEIFIDDKAILYILIPEGSQVQKCNNKIFIRNNEGDFDITDNNEEVTNLYIRKKKAYTENIIFPAVKIDK